MDGKIVEAGRRAELAVPGRYWIVAVVLSSKQVNIFLLGRRIERRGRNAIHKPGAGILNRYAPGEDLIIKEVRLLPAVQSDHVVLVVALEPVVIRRQVEPGKADAERIKRLDEQFV